MVALSLECLSLLLYTFHGRSGEWAVLGYIQSTATAAAASTFQRDGEGVCVCVMRLLYA